MGCASSSRAESWVCVHEDNEAGLRVEDLRLGWIQGTRLRRLVFVETEVLEQSCIKVARNKSICRAVSLDAEYLQVLPTPTCVPPALCADQMGMVIPPTGILSFPLLTGARWLGVMHQRRTGFNLCARRRRGGMADGNPARTRWTRQDRCGRVL